MSFSSGESPVEQGEYWQSHYDSMADRLSHTLFEAEACDYFERLVRANPLHGTERVLDFGCGLGVVSARIAGQTRELFFWDYSENMLAVAKHRLARFENAHAVSLDDLSNATVEKFDLIVVNSVVQYMSSEELAGWLGRWRELLQPDGRILVSDIILPHSSFLGETRDTLVFAAREGFLIRTLVQDFVQYFRYLLTRSQAKMSRYSVEEISDMARQAGLSAKVLDENLTYKQLRYTLELHSRAETG